MTSGGTTAETPTRSLDQEEKPVRRGNQSLVTGFQIIDFLLTCGRPVPLREISKGTGLAPNKLQFYLISLMEVGAVRKDPQSGHYGLGPYTLQLGVAALQQFNVFDAARTRMDGLAAEHGHSVFLGVWGNQGPTIIYRVSGHVGHTLLELRLGSVLPVLRSALGRIMMAYLPADLTKPYIDRELAITNLAEMGSDPEMPKAVSAASLRALQAAILNRGMSRSRGGLLLDHTAISAPIFDHCGMVIAAITVMGPIGLLEDDFEGPVAQDLRRVTSELSREGGAPSPPSPQHETSV